MGDFDAGVGVRPGADSNFDQFGVNSFLTIGVRTRVRVINFFYNWRQSRNRSQGVGLESEPEPALTGVAHL